MTTDVTLHERTELADRTGVFDDRNHAGRILADMLESYRGSQAIVMAIPAGGLPVAEPIARGLDLPLDVAVVSKIAPPWNSEVGYGAIAFDGTAVLNRDLLSHFDLSQEELQRGFDKTERKVARRMETLRGGRPMPDLTGRTVILVDDGIASGYTLRAAAKAMRKFDVATLVCAVPTAHRESIDEFLEQVDVLYCPNVRSGPRFAVAEAYTRWRDVPEEEAREILARSSTATEKGPGARDRDSV